MTMSERDSRERRFHALFVGAAPAIAALLDGEWKAEGQGENAYQWFKLRRADGLAVSLTLDTWKGRVNASPEVPKAPNGGYRSLRDWGVIPYNESGPSAGMAVDRDPKAMARDIMRKVVTPYQPLYAKILERQEAQNKASNKAGELVIALAKILGDTSALNTEHPDSVINRMKDERSGDVRLPYESGEFYGHFRVSPFAGGGVDVELHSVPHDTALALARVLKALREGSPS